MVELIGTFGNRLEGMPPRWIGAAWYLLPIAAGVCWTLAFRLSPPRPTRMHAYVGAAISFATVLYLSAIGIHAGPALALIGGLLMMISGWSSASMSARADRDSGSLPGFTNITK